MAITTENMAQAARVLELCNEAAFLAAAIGDKLVASLAGAAAIAAGEALSLSEEQVMRMQAEQSAERARISAGEERRMRQWLRRFDKDVASRADPGSVIRASAG